MENILLDTPRAFRNVPNNTSNHERTPAGTLWGARGKENDRELLTQIQQYEVKELSTVGTWISTQSKSRRIR